MKIADRVRKYEVKTPRFVNYGKLGHPTNTTSPACNMAGDVASSPGRV